MESKGSCCGGAKESDCGCGSGNACKCPPGECNCGSSCECSRSRVLGIRKTAPYFKVAAWYNKITEVKLDDYKGK